MAEHGNPFPIIDVQVFTDTNGDGVVMADHKRTATFKVLGNIVKPSDALAEAEAYAGRLRQAIVDFHDDTVRA